MTAVVLTLEAHQPRRLAKKSFADAGRGGPLFDEPRERREVERAAAETYVPHFAALLETVDATRGRFRCALAVSGALLARLERHAPAAVTWIVRLARTGAVEFVGGTAWHARVLPGAKAEVRAQIEAHREALWRLTGVEPRTFADPTLALDVDRARTAEELGFECVLADAAALAGSEPRRVHRVRGHRLAVLGCARRFPDELAAAPGGRADVACSLLALEDLGSPAALRARLAPLLANPALAFATPSEAARELPAAGELDPAPRGAAWLDSELQRDAWARLHALLPAVRAAAARARGAAGLLDDWRALSDCDHLRALSVPPQGGAAPDSPHESFITFMHALDDLRARTRSAERAAPATSRRKENR